MSLFVCESCGGIENTTTSRYWFRNSDKMNKGETRALCWNCDPNMKGRRGGHVAFHGQIVLNPEVAQRFYTFPVVPDECKHLDLPEVKFSYVGGKTLCMSCGSVAETIAPRGASGERGLYDRERDYEWKITIQRVLP